MFSSQFEKRTNRPIAAWKVIGLGVARANKTHLDLGTPSRENGTTVQAPVMETHLCRNRVHLRRHPLCGRYTAGGKNNTSSPSYTLTTPLTSAGAFFKPRQRPLVYQPSTAAQNNENRAAVVPRQKGFLTEFYFTADSRMTQGRTQRRYVLTECDAAGEALRGCLHL